MKKLGVYLCVLSLARSPPNDDRTREGNSPHLADANGGNHSPSPPSLLAPALAHGEGGGKIASPFLLLLMTKGDLPHFDQRLTDGYFLHLLHLKSIAIHPSRKSRKRNKARFLLIQKQKKIVSYRPLDQLYQTYRDPNTQENLIHHHHFFISINDRRPRSIDNQSTIDLLID